MSSRTKLNFRNDFKKEDEDVPKLAPETNPKSWKQTIGLTKDIIKRRMNRYYNIDDNPSDMRKVQNLLRKLMVRKLGIVSRLGKLIDIEKKNTKQYVIQYWVRFSRNAKPLKQNYLMVDRYGLEDFLKKYVAGVYAFDNDKLTTINYM